MNTPGHQLLVYDGDCAFCRYCVDYAHARTGDRVEYRPYQTLEDDFSDLPEQAFRDSVQLFVNGEHHSDGAEASFSVMHTGGSPAWLWLYRHVPGFAAFSEWLYRWVARHRPLCHWLARLLIGQQWRPLRYDNTIALFIRCLAVIYLLAFVSFAVQAQGLIGSQGILPIGDYLAAAADQLGAERYWYIPTLLWLSPADWAIDALCVGGIALSVTLWLGWWPRLSALLLFVLYLSVVHAGQVFTRYQWDVLLLECGFLAVVLMRWPLLGVWLYRWLLFRFMLLSGAAKLLSGDSTWWQLTALKYHFETQPLPTPIAWYMDHLPAVMLKTMAAGLFFIELVLPLLVLATRQLRLMAAAGIVLLQTIILLTGNYNFFNLLTIALCLLLLDDRMLPRRWHSAAPLAPAQPLGRLSRVSATAVLSLVLFLSASQLLQIFHKPISAPLVQSALRTAQPLHLVNTYGLFANMTTERYEILIEGSMDGYQWRRFPFRYKPDRPDEAPAWVAPHQPRLDWQMWFAALSTFDRQYWLQQVLVRLGTGSETVTGLFAQNPFPDKPPRYMRARVYQYRFTDPETRRRTGRWWERELLGNYSPVIRLSLVPEQISL